MTDLTSGPTATVACPTCGARSARGAVRCTDCGSPLDPAAAPDASDAEVEVDEAWRAAAAGGYDTEVAWSDGTLRCSHCGGTYPPAEARVAQRQPTIEGTVVLSLTCPRCGRLGRAEVDADALDDADADAGRSFGIPGEPEQVDESEIDHRRPPPEGATPEHPLGEDRRFFDEGGPGTLAERGPLTDADGEDIRQYTGEPVETEEGWVVPVQQNVGPGNEAGGGEFPDPNAPSAMPKD
jgi:hypothetical protein